uniref:PREY protein n=1 Tax=Nothoprocta perdicaria TaxID=30464 RepID=A0A8C6ZP78_NOTPE
RSPERSGARTGRRGGSRSGRRHVARRAARGSGAAAAEPESAAAEVSVGRARGLAPSPIAIPTPPALPRSPRYEAATQELVNEELGIAYPVVDGIPTMLPEAARKVPARPAEQH